MAAPAITRALARPDEGILALDPEAGVHEAEAGVGVRQRIGDGLGPIHLRQVASNNWGAVLVRYAPCGRPRIRRRGETSSQRGYRWRPVGTGSGRWDERGWWRGGSVGWDRIRRVQTQAESVGARSLIIAHDHRPISNGNVLPLNFHLCIFNVYELNIIHV